VSVEAVKLWVGVCLGNAFPESRVHSVPPPRGALFATPFAPLTLSQAPQVLPLRCWGTKRGTKRRQDWGDGEAVSSVAKEGMASLHSPW